MKTKPMPSTSGKILMDKDKTNAVYGNLKTQKKAIYLFEKFTNLNYFYLQNMFNAAFI